MKKAKRIALGAAAALAAYLALLALASLLIVRGGIGEDKGSLLIWLFALIASFLGAKLSAFRDGKPLAASFLCAAAFWLMILLCGFAANDALDASRAAALILPILAGAAAAYLTRGSGKQGRRTRKRRRT